MKVGMCQFLINNLPSHDRAIPTLSSRNATVNGDEKDPNVIWWDNEDDPHNPLNWTEWRKWTTIAIISTTTFVT